MSPSPQNRSSQSSKTSNEENTCAPMLTGSSSSFDDSPLVSPFSAHFSCSSNAPPSKQPAYEPPVCYEEHPEAWWSRRGSVDSSGSAPNPLDFRPHGLLKLRAPCDILGAARGDYANTRSEGLMPTRAVDQANKVRSLVSETYAPQLTLAQQSILSQSSVQEADSELPSTSTQATPASALNVPSPADTELGRSFESLPPSSDSCLAEPLAVDVNVIPPSPEEMHRNTTRRSSFPAFGRTRPHQDPAIDSYSCLNGSSRPQSSVLACDQHSLFPPSESLAQTHSGRLRLRDAGIPHGSSKALAPSMPLENVAPKDIRRQTSQFFQRLVRRTFARPQAIAPPASVPSRPPQGDGAAAATRVPSRPRAARYSMSFSFSRTEPSLPKKEEEDSNPPKQSRWKVIQRFIAKPGAAAKAAAFDAGLAPPSRPYLTSARLSSVSFFGDAMARVDPFARPNGLGATVSDSIPVGQLGYPTTPAPRRASMATGASAHTFERFSHVVSFPSGDSSMVSQGHTEESVSEFQTPTTDRTNLRDSGIDVVGSSFSGTADSQDLIEPPGVNSKYVEGRPGDRMERRHSLPMLNAVPRREGTTLRASMSRL
ncbi:hypothetical protein FRC07_000383 [Ceratobasidium sp. 392]|nr:hypothetical protein FRC07_000383 [Ceratobasidium sp. 392]